MFCSLTGCYKIDYCPFKLLKYIGNCICQLLKQKKFLYFADRVCLCLLCVSHINSDYLYAALIVQFV